MSMNREEAINRIENHMEVHGIGEYPHIALKEALDMAITALRPVSREQVEKVWRGCINCHDKEELAKHIHCWPSFCPVCGRPLTDEAVEIRLKELEALRDNHI